MEAPRQDQCGSALRIGRGCALLLLSAAAWLATGASAVAHGTERGFVLLLPTGYYLAGGAAAVGASFLLVSLAPARAVERLAGARLRLATLPAISPVATSLAAFLFLALLIAAGLFGSRDPLANPLPLTIWTLWWVGLVLLHPLIGNLWFLINPWVGPYRLLDRLAGGRLSGAPPLAYPDWLGYWPALILFLGFAWLELVHPAPDDPEVLAYAVALYWIIAFAGMLLFGYEAWIERGEPFSIFFRLLGGLSPLLIGPAAEPRHCSVTLALPGAALVERSPLPFSGVLFVLATLSSVSFDGLSKTFWWLALGGINPLEFPGRTALIGRNTTGLLLAFTALSVAYVAAIRLGWIVAGMRRPLLPALGAFVYSIVPISIAFHFAHYLTALLVDGQYALAAASDPLGNGANLLGFGHHDVTTSFLNTYAGVCAIWNVQTLVIVIGHVAGIAMAHALALRHFGDGRGAVASQVPLALFMVLYTLFGLWLLATPVVA